MNLKVVSVVLLAFVIGIASLGTDIGYSGRGGIAAPRDLTTPAAEKARRELWTMTNQRADGAVAPPAGTRRKEPKSDLERRLAAIAGASFPEQRRIVFEARENLSHLEEPLLEALRDQNYHLLAPAIWLAGELQVRNALPMLRSLARTSYELQIRLDAFRAAELIEPWPHEILLEFLADDDTRVAQTVLGVVRSRPDHSLELLLELVRQSNDDVRRAVARRLPQLADPEKMSELASSSMQSILLGKVRTGNANEQLDALQALADTGTPLAKTDEIYKLLSDRLTPWITKRTALIALERTRSVDADKVAALVPELDQVLRFYAARCLITAGDEFGIHVLAQVARVRHSNHRDLRDRAIELLSHISGRQYDEVWVRQWALSRPSLAKVALPAPKLFD